RLAAAGQRVLAVADGDGPEERALTLRGLIGIADPPRAAAIDAIRRAREAGVRLFMLTGDQRATALAIARELELAPPGEDVSAYVRARVTAAEKDAIVGELQARGEIVAMTGDGVNDAPAIRRADIGVAMGAGATEVTREVSDMVLTNDDLGGVVVAIREGRVIYENIQKTIVYLLSGNLSELMLMLAAAAIGLPLPLLPLHLLWINLLNEPLPAIALVLDPPARDVLERPPRAPGEPMLGRGPWAEILAIASLHAVVALAVYWWALAARGVDVARALAFSTIVFGVLLRSLGARSRSRPLGLRGLLENRWLLGVVGLSIALQLGIHYLPPTRALLRLDGAPARDLLLVLALGLVPLVAVELYKLARARVAGR
ncbi:MAG: cation-transporting P-type ATPase, partial [Myxococcales bacterium]|nr:cation-transporting P-type ATPase [Myxococcales bacterium]